MRTPDAPAAARPVGAVALLGLALCVVLTTVPGSTAAFTAQVTNTGDTVGTNRYFTCQDAVRGDGAYFAHSLDDDPPNNQATARDATLNNRPGTYGAGPRAGRGAPRR